MNFTELITFVVTGKLKRHPFERHAADVCASPYFLTQGRAVRHAGLDRLFSRPALSLRFSLSCESA